MEVSQLHILIGWGSMILGALSGAIIGLFFHRDEWAGGYASFRRRLMRLGHIAFFGLGILNLLFGFTVQTLALAEPLLTISSTGFMLAVIAMPLCCFLSAWRKPFRHLFPIPVLGVMAGVVPIVVGGIGA
jgi:hypothetical protein